jgi:hypothetical protein
MSQLPPAPAPQQPGLDTLKVRGRLRAVWLALWLAGAAGCVAVGLYEDTAEPWSHAWWWLPLFLSLAAVLVVLGVRSFGRGLDADGDGVVVRNMFRAKSIPWRDLAAIEYSEVWEDSADWKDSKVWDITGWFCKLDFQRRDGSRVTADAPGGGIRSGEYLFELRKRLLAMRSAAGEDQEGDREDSWPTYPESRTSRVPRQTSPSV